MDYWEESDSVVAQALANFLRTRVAGFDPMTDIPLNAPDEEIPVLPDLSAELVRKNVSFLQTAVLAGLIHGTPEERRRILEVVDASFFHDKSDRQYMFNLIAAQFRDIGDIHIGEIQDRLLEFTRIVYGEPPTRRDLLGIYYRWAQILKLRPDLDSTLKAIGLLRQLMHR